MAPPKGNLISALPRNGPGRTDLAVETVLLAIAYVSLGLRLWSRRLQRAEWQLNDWLIIIATVNPSSPLPFPISLPDPHHRITYGLGIVLISRRFLANTRGLSNGNTVATLDGPLCAGSGHDLEMRPWPPCRRSRGGKP